MRYLRPPEGDIEKSDILIKVTAKFIRAGVVTALLNPKVLFSPSHISKLMGVLNLGLNIKDILNVTSPHDHWNTLKDAETNYICHLDLIKRKPFALSHLISRQFSTGTVVKKKLCLS